MSQKGEVMNVVISGTGIIGSKVVEKLKRHEASAARKTPASTPSPGEGLKEAVAGSQVVIDPANSPSFEDKAVLEYFEPYTIIHQFIEIRGGVDVR